ncbi:MAG: lipopolysaccharide biosynthesis protein [Gammaproteobacteria bacterium]|nr:MAG: lipopolysaccharide biosynthesis protein [Gammaproteobacteria bacterium]
MDEIKNSEFKNKVLSAVRWFALIKFASQAFAWFMTFFVMTILKPEDYGLFALATVVIGLLTLVSELGLGAVLVQKEKLTLYQKQQIYGLVIVTGVIICLIVMCSAPLLSYIYKEPRLLFITIVLGLQFLLVPFQVIPFSLLERELDFKKRSGVEFFSAVIGGLSTLIAALNGMEVWSLVIGNLMVLVVKIIGLNIVAPFRHKPIFDFSGIRDMLSFGGYTIGSRSLWFIYSNADVMIAGLFLKTKDVGLYKFATHIASLPAQKISPIVNQVAFPAFSRIQHDKELVGAHYLKAVSLMSLVAFPILWGFACVAPSIPFYLGDHWSEAVFPLQLMCFVTPFRMLNSLTQPITSGIGRADISFRNQLYFAVVLVSSYLIGCWQWELIGLVCAWAFSFPLVSMRNLYFSLPLISVSLFDMLKRLVRPMAISCVMAGTVFVLRALLIKYVVKDVMAVAVFSPKLSQIQQLLEGGVLGGVIISGAVIYIVLSMLFNRDNAQVLLKVFGKK